MKRNNKHKAKKQEISLMTILANEATRESDNLLKKHNKEAANNYADLENKLAQLYFEQDDKLALEKEMANIHPHKNWIIRTLDLKPKGLIECSNCDWSWEKSKGGENPYKCHKCGTENDKKEIKPVKTNEEIIEKAVSNSIDKFSDFNGNKVSQENPSNKKSYLELIGLVGAIGIIGVTLIVVSKNLTK